MIGKISLDPPPLSEPVATEPPAGVPQGPLPLLDCKREPTSETIVEVKPETTANQPTDKPTCPSHRCSQCCVLHPIEEVGGCECPMCTVVR